MKMKNCFLFVLCFGLTYFRGVLAEHEHKMKKGIFPYMAIIYYSDPSVVDSSGDRYMRTAVIIREEWLVTSAMGQNFINPTNGFPRKTLLARAGAVTIDANFTFNEEEDEQEREVVQIVRPYNHSATQWWTTDISLMKTLFPFNITAAVGVKNLNVKRELDEKTCSILVFTKLNKSEEKSLVMLSVEMLPPSLENCGSHFAANTMVCANDGDGNKKDLHDPEFCRGNSGGPLICDREVMGLQTYIDNDCRQPHLYQLLPAWDNFITCGIENKCEEEQCGNICDVTYKDPPAAVITAHPSDENNIVDLASAPSTTEELSTNSSITTITEVPTRLDNFLTEDMVTKSTILSTTETTTESESTTMTEETQTEFSEVIGSWPKEASITPQSTSPETNQKAGDAEREASVEAQQIETKKTRSASTRNMCVVNTLFIGFLVLVCL